MIPDPGGEIVEWTHPLGTCKIRPYPGGPIVPIIRYKTRDDADIFPLEHVYHDRSQLGQQENLPEDPYSVGELTLRGKKGDGWTNRPSKKYQKKILWRRNWQPLMPEGLTGHEFFGTDKAFLGELEDDGQWSGTLLNPWTATAEQLAAIPEALKARFRRHADACRCSTPAGHGVTVVPLDGDACECSTANAQVVNLAGNLGEACACSTADLVIT